jgi:DNA-binding NtrC family response regulator
MNFLPRVLVACRDEQCRRTVTDVLVDWGIEAVPAASVKDALNALQTQRISLIFSEDKFDDGSYRDLVGPASLRKPAVRMIALIHEEDNYSEVLLNGAFDALPIPFSRSDIQWAVIHATGGADKAPYRPSVPPQPPHLEHKI